KAPGKGTGLGLSVTYAIVQSQNGFIDVASEPGRGSTFNIYLPIPKEPAVLAEAAETFADKEAKTPAGHGETVLFVEDELEQVKLMETFLTDEGFNVLTARDGEDAIAVVVLDLGLAKLNGWEAFRIMKQMNPKLKGILASGFLSAEVKSQLANGTLSALVPKPYEPRQLLTNIERAIHA